MNGRCSHRSMDGYQCPNKKLEGFVHCDIHDPEKIIARRAKEQARADEKARLEKLHAAAPDMLEALREAKDFIDMVEIRTYDHEGIVHAIVDAAIAKATS